MHSLDHLLWGGDSLPEMEAAFGRVSGVELAGGGAHPGFGTHNNLASLGSGVYFEAIAPDPAQAERSARARRLGLMKTPRMHAFAVRGSDVEAYRDLARGAGLGASDPIGMSRTRKDGTTLRWRVVYVEDDRWGDVIPFMIDWQDSQHPSETTPVGCELTEFRVLHPEAETLSGIFRRMEIPVPVTAAPSAGFLARLKTPRGEMVLV